LSSLKTDPDTSGIFSQGLAYRIENRTFVVFGVLHKSLMRKFDFRQDVFYADINWSLLLSNLKAGDKTVAELPKFPEVRRDLALQLDRPVLYAELEKLAFATEKKLLKEVGLFDVYEGEKIEAGKKSYALYFILQDDQKTLTDEDIDKAMKRLIKVYTEKVNAQVR
jgi:phenylalanyl-tRNA synthetase beta chain